MKETSKKSGRPGKLPPNGPPFIPPGVIPDRLKVPKDTILLVPDSQIFVDPPHFVKAGQQRDWFDSYFYHCLPLVMGNQHGFLMLATYDFVCRWNGSHDVDGVSIHILEPVLEPNYVTLESHFGFGILTIQSRYIFRTPAGVNLMVKEPPNYPIHGFSWMNAVVETDNLRRDFTFNIKITQPHLDIYIPRNTPLGCLLPYPRYFLDSYNMAELKDPEELRRSERTVNYFSTERDDFDISPRHRYMEGVDVYNIEFKHHQKTLDSGKWWFSKRKKHIPIHLSDAIKSSDHSLLSGITNIFSKFLLLSSNALANQNASNDENGLPEKSAKEAFFETENSTINGCDLSPLHGKKSLPTGKEEAMNPLLTAKTEQSMPIESDKHVSEETAAKCPVKHGAQITTSKASEASSEELQTSRASLKPENFPEIMELNADLPESSITLYLPSNYDKSLAPVKAERLRTWFEQDKKTKDHARFCLPLTMGSGIGWFILSPATFTVSWDGDPTHDAEVQILDGSSHTNIDNHSAHGSFTIQSQFVPRTKRPGDFVFVKGIGNQYRLPYYFLEAMLEAWWSPANFGLVAMINQPGKFTIQKGEPVAQMFAINVEQANYKIAFRDGYPAHWKEWDDKRRAPSYTGKNLDYLKGLWPDETPVCPHFKSWSAPGTSAATPTTDAHQSVDSGQIKAISPAQEKLVYKTNEQSTESASLVNPHELVQKARLALSKGNSSQAEDFLHRARIESVKGKAVGLDLISTMHSLGHFYLQKPDFEKSIFALTEALKLCQQAKHVEYQTLVGILNDLAYAERSTKLFSKAEEHYAAALEQLMHTKDEVAIATSTFCLSSLYDQIGRYQDSEPLMLEALEIRKRKLGDKHPDTLFTLNGLACLYTHQMRLAEAEEIFAKVIADRTEVLGADSLDVADSYNDLGFLHLAVNDFTKAIDVFQCAALIRKDRLGEESLGYAEFLTNIAFTYRQQGDFLQAKEYFEKILAIKEKCLPARHSDVTRCLEDLAHAHLDLGNKDRAEQLFQRAKTS